MGRSGTTIIYGLVLVMVTAIPAQAYVQPMRGGSQVSAPMIMPEIWFDGTNMRVTNGAGNPWPVFPWSQAPYLRPLIAPNEFDPTLSWKVLIGKPYNFQYGWTSHTSEPFPPESQVWIQVLNQSDVLETYYKDGGYAPIFGTPDEYGDPSLDIWWWNGGMRHNTYAVPGDFYGRLSAEYKVYLGDADGNEIVDDNNDPVYGSALVTLRWLRPSLYILQGDIDTDGIVDFRDFSIVANQWLDTTCADPENYGYWCDEADIDHSGAVDVTDLDLLTENWLTDCHQTPSDPCCFPRPGPW